MADDGILAIVPEAWGPKTRTSVGCVALVRCGPDSIRFVAPAHLVVILLTQQPNREAALSTDCRRHFQAPVGTVEIMPYGSDFYGSWSVAKETILLGVDDVRLCALAEREFGTDRFEWRPPPHSTIDPQALGLAQALRFELARDDGANPLFVETVTTALSLHLLREYSSFADRRPAHSRTKGGLAPGIWRRIDAHMRAHLHEQLTIASLAGMAGLSSSHFLRAFREHVGKPPYAYLTDLRIREAERLALETELPLAEVARRSGFSNQSHMTTVLRCATLKTPGELRRLRHMTGPGK
jgi:AraC family transcriptional regulator